MRTEPGKCELASRMTTSVRALIRPRLGLSRVEEYHEESIRLLHHFLGEIVDSDLVIHLRRTSLRHIDYQRSHGHEPFERNLFDRPRRVRPVVRRIEVRTEMLAGEKISPRFEVRSTGFILRRGGHRFGDIKRSQSGEHGIRGSDRIGQIKIDPTDSESTADEHE